MLIANPIYDVTFKRLLENNRVAKFLIGTILNCKVLSLDPSIQEHSEFGEDAGKLTLFRMDFAATIETEEEDEKRVIIEMQKALHLGDVYRFRKYLGKEYRESKLPIISIYILGFNLSVDSPAFAAHPCYRDLTTNEKLEINDHFVEHLTHKSYFVQAKKIKPSYNTRLEKLLSIFEQSNFAGDSKTTKHFLFETDDHEIKEVLKVLHYVAVDKETREKLDKEDYYQGAMEEMFGAKDRELADTKVKLEKANKEFGLQVQVVEQQGKKLEQKDKELGLQAQALEQQQREIETLKKQLVIERGKTDGLVEII
jgi:hypothetical protein